LEQVSAEGFKRAAEHHACGNVGAGLESAVGFYERLIERARNSIARKSLRRLGVDPHEV
jgi:hypothetical protein